MKRKLNGFTLVELIVVMAIMSILMLAVMNMFQPIRNTYVDTTQFLAQRTAQNGVVQYITESIRYATDMGVYNDVSSAQDAAKAFAEAYCDANGYNKADINNLQKIYKHAEIIIIDNKTTHYSKNHTGRLIRRKVNGTSFSIPEPSLKAASTDDWRIALGEGYYGENTYYITLDTSESGSGMFTVSVASTRNSKRDISRAGKENIIAGADGGDYNTGTDTATIQTKINNNKIAVTRGGVLCRNLVNSSGYGVNKAGIYDAQYSNVNANSKNAYIVFVNKDGKDAIEAEGLTVAP